MFCWNCILTSPHKHSFMSLWCVLFWKAKIQEWRSAASRCSQCFWGTFSHSKGGCWHSLNAYSRLLHNRLDPASIVSAQSWQCSDTPPQSSLCAVKTETFVCVCVCVCVCVDFVDANQKLVNTAEPEKLNFLGQLQIFWGQLRFNLIQWIKQFLLPAKKKKKKKKNNYIVNCHLLFVLWLSAFSPQHNLVRCVRRARLV